MHITYLQFSFNKFQKSTRIKVLSLPSPQPSSLPKLSGDAGPATFLNGN